VIIAATGHRPHKLGQEYNYQGPYSTYLTTRVREILIEKSAEQVISGLALGFDTIVAHVALELGIPLLAAIPFKGQESRWPKSSQQIYNNILSNPLTTAHIVCEGGYNSAKMQIRNEFMIDSAQILMVAWNSSPGGTMNCVRYAEKQDIEIIFINPDGWKPKNEAIQSVLF